MKHRRIRNIFTALAGFAVLCVGAASTASAFPYWNWTP